MKWFSKSLPKMAISKRRYRLLGVEPLEGRRLMSLGGSPAYDSTSREVMDVVYPNSTLYEYDAAGHSTLLGDHVISASVAIDPLGRKVQDVVFDNGELYEFDSGGAHYLGNNVMSASVAVSPSGSLVQDVVFTNGHLYQFDSSGAHDLGSNVTEISVSFQHLGGSGEIQDIVFNNGNLYEYDSTGAHYLGDHVVSAGVAEDFSNGGQAGNLYTESSTQVVLFSSGLMYQYDQSGTHYLGMLFTPIPNSTPTLPSSFAPSYNGVIVDYASNTNGNFAAIAPTSGNNISLENVRSFSDPLGDNVTGTLTITSWGGDAISVEFLGVYSTIGTTQTFDITNLSPGDPVSFGFDFQINTDGSLYATHGLGGGFYVEDTNNGLFDESVVGPEYYVKLVQ